MAEYDMFRVMKTIVRSVLLTGALLMPIAGAADPAPAYLPPGVAAAEKTTAEWLSQFKTKTRAELEKKLGPPAEVGSWENGKYHGVKLRYPLSAVGRVDFLFGADDHVNTISYLVLL